MGKEVASGERFCKNQTQKDGGEKPGKKRAFSPGMRRGRSQKKKKKPKEKKREKKTCV